MRPSGMASAFLVLIAGVVLASTGCRRAAPTHGSGLLGPLLAFVSRERDGRRQLGVMSEDGSIRRMLPGTEEATGFDWLTPTDLIYVRGDRLWTCSIEADGAERLDTGGRVPVRIRGFGDDPHVMFSWFRPFPDHGNEPHAGLAILDVQTGELHEVPGAHASVTAFAPSPGGSRVAVGDDLDGLKVLSLLGSSDGVPLASAGDHRRIAYTSWSPDGRFIAFVRLGILPKLPPSELCIYDSADSTVQVLATWTKETFFAGWAWHPKEPWLAFVLAIEQTGQSCLRIARWDESQWAVSEVLTAGGAITLGGWDPLQLSFAYTLAVGGRSHVYICEDEIQAGERISPEQASDFVPRWRPAARRADERQ